jgi:hypothetical protein
MAMSDVRTSIVEIARSTKKTSSNKYKPSRILGAVVINIASIATIFEGMFFELRHRILEWAATEMNCHFRQVAIDSNTIKPGQGAPVEIDRRPIFLAQTSVGSRSPGECAEKIQHRVINIAENNDYPERNETRTAENKPVNTAKLSRACAASSIGKSVSQVRPVTIDSICGYIVFSRLSVERGGHATSKGHAG